MGHSVEPILIGDRHVGSGYPPYVVAEAAVNHQGDVRIAEKMVRLAHAVGVDAIKFQFHVLDNEMLREAPQSDNFAEPLYDTLAATNLTLEEHRSLKELCEQLGIVYLCTPFSRAAADILVELDVPALKVGSGELTNLPLQEHIARKGKPVIVSTGMSEIDEIEETVALLKSIGTPFMLTHCTSVYPAPYSLANLKMIPRYEEMFGVPIGLSDHTRGIYTSIAAVALGACLVEKHFTLDKLARGPDHASSLEPFELAELVKGTSAAHDALGDEKKIYEEEKEIFAWARESVVSERPIPAGTKIETDMIWVKRPAPQPGAIAAKFLNDVIGKTAVSDIPADVQIRWEQLK